MKTTQAKIQEVSEMMIDFFSGVNNIEEIAKKLNKDESEVGEFLSQASNEWNDLPADSEGETKEQAKENDKWLEDKADDLINL